MRGTLGRILLLVLSLTTVVSPCAGANKKSIAQLDAKINALCTKFMANPEDLPSPAELQELLQSAVSTYGEHDVRTTSLIVLLATKTLLSEGLPATLSVLQHYSIATEKTSKKDVAELVVTVRSFASMLAQAGAPDLGQTLLSGALRQLELTNGPVDLRAAAAYAALASICLATRNEQCTNENLSRSQDIGNRFSTDESPDAVMFLVELATTLNNVGQFSSAAPLASQAVQIGKRARPPNNVAIIEALEVSGQSQLGLKDFSMAHEEFTEALNISNSMSGATVLLSVGAASGLAQVAIARSQTEVAEKQLEQLIKTLENTSWVRVNWYLSILDKLASLYAKRGAGDLAEPIYRKILATRQADPLPNQLEIARALGTLGACLYAQGKYSDAEPVTRQNLEMLIVAKGPEDSETISVSINLARVYFREAKWDLGRELMHRALEYYRSHPNADPETLALLTEEAGFAEFLAKNDEAAVTLLREALKLRQQVSGVDSPRTADVEDELAKALARTKDFAGAKSAALHAISIRRSTYGEKANDHGLLDIIAAAYISEGDHRQAIDTIVEWVSAIEQGQGSEAASLAPVLDSLATEQLLVGQTEESWVTFQRSLAIAEQYKTKKPTEIAARQIEFGWLLANQGEASRAALLIESGINIRRRESGFAEPDQVIRTNMRQLAEVYFAAHQYARATQLLSQVLAICERQQGPSDKETKAVLKEAGQMSVRADDFSQAAAYFTRLAAVPDSSPLEYFEALSALGDTYVAQRNYRSALVVFRKMLTICNRNHDLQCGGRAQYRLGDAYYQLGKLAEAELSLRESLASLDNERLDEKVAQMNRAAIYLKLAKLYVQKDLGAAAETNFVKARSTFESVRGPDDSWASVCSWQLGYLYFKLGRFDRAVNEFRQGIRAENLNVDKARLLGSEYQLARTLAIVGLDDRYRHILSIPPSETSDARATLFFSADTILQRKGRLEEVLADELLGLRQSLEPGVVDELAELRRIKARLTELSLDLSAPAVANETQDLLTRSEELQILLSRRNSRPPLSMSAPSVAQVQRHIPNDTALVEFLEYKRAVKHQEMLPGGDWRTSNAMRNLGRLMAEMWGTPSYVAYVFLSDGDPIRLDFGESEPLNRSALRFRASMSNTENGSTASELARELDEKLMRPVRKVIGRRTKIFVSPDGDLGLIPFAALRDETGHYLAERYQFTLLDSGRNLLRLEENPPPRSTAKIYADPGLSKDSHRFASSRSADREEVLNMRFESLPAAGTEANQLAAILNVGSPLTGPAATKQSLTLVKGPQILHIATHGVFLKNLPDATSDPDWLKPSNHEGLPPPPQADAMYRSGLVFSDGILTAAEASSLDLWGTQLVVLSACETGIGDVHNGDGIIGLRRGFFLAGARSILMSLWRVNDEATRDLMLSFYEKILGGQGKSEALRTTQLEMINRKLPPYYWAAWILSGDGGPITQ